MPLEFFFGIALLVVVVYIIFRVIGNVALGALLVLVVFLASYLLLGSFPSLGGIPVVGKFIPTTGKAIAVIKNFAYSMDIIGVSTSSNGNLLLTLVNTGRLEVSNFTAYVDDQQVEILNEKDSLSSGDVVVFELDWKEDFKRILIDSDHVEAVYEKPV
ncbi:MAG: hypothetical protein HYS80_00070 [Candidatus Aenigmarchaeota archaeon]|nr:hypothetical protein [Candidatus Aenigmarchaeota archaeon]